MNRWLLTALLLLIGFQPVQAAITLKIATVAPDGTIWMQALRKGGEEIAKRTEGRVSLRFFPGGVMGNDKSVLRKIRIGQLQGGVIVSGGLTEVYPDIALYNIPFTFRSYEEADYVRQRMDSQLIEGLAQHGFISFGFSEGGFAYLMSNKPVRSIDDLKGHKVWVPEDDVISRIVFDAINVTPIPLPLTDVLTGLQTGLIDTVAGSAIGAIALQWHTQVKYLIDEPLVYLYGTLVLDRKAFQRILPGDQAIIKEVMNSVFQELNRQNRLDDDRARQALKTQGISFVDPGEESRLRKAAIKEQAEMLLLQRNILSPQLVKALNDHITTLRQSKITHE